LFVAALREGKKQKTESSTIEIRQRPRFGRRSERKATHPRNSRDQHRSAAQGKGTGDFQSGLKGMGVIQKKKVIGKKTGPNIRMKRNLLEKRTSLQSSLRPERNAQDGRRANTKSTHRSYSYNHCKRRKKEGGIPGLWILSGGRWRENCVTFTS